MSHGNSVNFCATYAATKELERPGTSAPHCSFVLTCDGSRCQKGFAPDFIEDGDVLPDPRDAAQDTALTNIIGQSVIIQLHNQHLS